jgi:hypothetical protein
MYGSYNTWLVRWITSRGTTITTTTSTMDTHRLLPIIVWNHICVVTSLSPYSIVSLLCFCDCVPCNESRAESQSHVAALDWIFECNNSNGRNRPSRRNHTSFSVCNKCIQHTAAIRNCSTVILNFSGAMLESNQFYILCWTIQFYIYISMWPFQEWIEIPAWVMFQMELQYWTTNHHQTSFVACVCVWHILRSDDDVLLNQGRLD